MIVDQNPSQGHPIANKTWFRSFSAPVKPRLRLVCLHHAGGNAMFFRSWPARLPSDVELLAVQLPGRAPRLREPAFTNVRELVRALADVMPVDGLATVIFGHSMGALLNFELTLELRRRGLKLPVKLLMSGCMAPSTNRIMSPIYTLSEPAFRSALWAMGGFPQDIYDNEAFMDFLSPMLRADFELVDTFLHEEEPTLDIPIEVFGSAEDPQTNIAGLEAWARHTEAGCQLELFSGNHFFLQSDEATVLKAITRSLAISAL